jgi:hypothetical protein
MCSGESWPALESIRQGTLPVGEYCRMRDRVSGRSSAMRTSPNSTAAIFMASQGRSDQLE